MKNIIPVVVILILLGVGGYYFMSSGKLSTKVGSPAAPVNQQIGSSVFSSIKDALSKSMSLKCEYPDPVTKGTVTSYIKNGAVRVGNFTLTDKNKGNAIIKNNQMWVWNEGEKTGMIISLKTEKTQEQTEKDQQQQMLDEIEKNKQYCKVDVVADSLFNPPTDVKFTDLGAAFQNTIISGMPTIELPAEK